MLTQKKWWEVGMKNMNKNIKDKRSLNMQTMFDFSSY